MYNLFFTGDIQAPDAGTIYWSHCRSWAIESLTPLSCVTFLLPSLYVQSFKYEKACVTGLRFSLRLVYALITTWAALTLLLVALTGLYFRMYLLSRFFSITVCRSIKLAVEWGITSYMPLYLHSQVQLFAVSFILTKVCCNPIHTFMVCVLDTLRRPHHMRLLAGLW